MQQAVYLFAGGYAFFIGLLLTVVAVSLCVAERPAWVLRVGKLLLLVAVIVVAFSAAPLSWWAYLLYGAVIAAFLVAEHYKKSRRKVLRVTFGMVVTASLALAVWEARYVRGQPMPFPENGTLYVLGDSLSIGADTLEGNWPQLLGAHAGLPVENLGFGGATTSSALSNAKRVEDDAAIVVIELGGNDLLGGASAASFEEGLRAILETVARPERRIVLVGLPLPPGYNRFGTAQRRLARDYGAYLVPRRVLARVITTPGATTDGLHLSNAGHEQLAAATWRFAGRE